MTNTTRQTVETLICKAWKFGCIDARGREIGCTVTLQVAEYAPSDGKWGRSVEPGRYFEACVQGTRSGKRFAEAQDAKLFATRAEAEAYIAKRLEASAKAAKQKVGK